MTEKRQYPTDAKKSLSKNVCKHTGALTHTQQPHMVEYKPKKPNKKKQ